MESLDDTELWEVLQTYDSSPAIATMQLDGVLDDFIAVLHAYCRDEKYIAERTRTLNYYRGKLAAFMEAKTYTSKKHTVLRIIVKRAVSAIDSELFLVKMDLEHPERFLEFPSDTPPLARWGGNVVDLVEYFIGPQAAGLLQHPSGKPMNYEESIWLIEKIFGITVSQPHDRRGKTLDRQKNTTFQDEMRRVYLEEAKKRNK
jgi:hypothetical protein